MNSLDVLTNFTANVRLDEANMSALEHDTISHRAAPPTLEKSL